MIIQNPLIPDDDTEPGEIPLVIPEPTDPDPDDDLIPVNVAPDLRGNAPPEWKPVRPQAIKTPDGIYAIFPTGWKFSMLMGGMQVGWDGVNEYHIPPEQGFPTRGVYTSWYRADGAHGLTEGFPDVVFSSATTIPTGWEYVSQAPPGFIMPDIPSSEDSVPRNYASCAIFHYGGEGWIQVTWGLWNRLNKPEHVEPELWAASDVYIRSYEYITYGLFVLTRRPRQGHAGIIPIMATLVLAALFGSVANTQPTANAARRRRYVKNHIGQ